MILNWRLIKLMSWRWGFWVRICGKGFWIKVDDGLVLFSDRYGYKKFWYFCGLKMRLLK